MGGRGTSSEKKRSLTGTKDDSFHVTHKLPPGDSPYGKAKHAQLVEKDPEAAVVLFKKAINGGDRVESAVKDMALVLKQLDRSEEAIKALKIYRHLFSKQAQESLDNLLLDLYKKCGKIDEQIELLKRKLRLIYLGEAFNGKPTKTARSHGKKFQVSVKRETSRLLGNLGWAYMQKSDSLMAEVVYKKAQMIDPDANRACSLGQCLMQQGRYDEALPPLQEVLNGEIAGSDDPKVRKRAQELKLEAIFRHGRRECLNLLGFDLDGEVVDRMEWSLSDRGPFRSKRLPIFEQISSFGDQLACN